ncbi:mitochondrial fission ELM1 family protein [Pseudoteredinibacter isoporae]|uniref:mitochondrial fission ELM1 family protein n=1 Tax=Pseudoteredinibacter isoporae TaxID=570281 RepID=UPI00310B796B
MDIKLLIFSDGKPGHLNQSLGLVYALRRAIADLPQFQDAQIHHDIVEPLSHVQALMLWLGFSNAPRHWPEHCDVLLAAGHACHSSLIVAKKHYQAKSLVLMKPSFPLRCFDVCIAPAHDELAVTDKVIVTEGALNPVVYRGENKTLNMMLIGGPSKHFHWNDEQVLQQIGEALAKQSAKDAEREWLLISSRRTPESFYERLDALNLPVTLLKPDDVDAGWLATQLPSAKECWVSPDSVSMVYEALTAEAQVSIFSLAECPPTSRVAKGLRTLIEAGRVRELSAGSRSASSAESQGNTDAEREPFNQADQVARILLDQYAIFDQVASR